MREHEKSHVYFCSKYYSRSVYRDRSLGSLALGEIVVAQHKGDDSWCRVRVVDTDDHNFMVKACLIRNCGNGKQI